MNPLPKELRPGTLAPVTGLYQQINVFGTPIGAPVAVRASEKLPAAPRNWAWVLTDQDADIRHQADAA